jgi:hypothetical protein
MHAWKEQALDFFHSTGRVFYARGAGPRRTDNFLIFLIVRRR